MSDLSRTLAGGVLAGICALLAACQSDSNNDDQTFRVPVTNIPGSELRSLSSQQETRDLVVKGLTQSRLFYQRNEVLEDLFATEPANSIDEANAGNEPSSQTNVVEQGVDEADFLKFENGTALIARNAQHYWIQEQDQPRLGAKIQAVKLTSEPSQEFLGEYFLDSSAQYVEGLYSHNQSTVTLSTSYGQGLGDNENSDDSSELDWIEPWYWYQTVTVLEGLNIQDPSNITPQWKIKLDGSLLDSRRHNDKLTLVTLYSPNPDGLPPYYDNDMDAFEAAAQDINYEDIAPKLSFNDGESVNLADNCMFQSGDEWQSSGYYSFYTILQVDLNDPENYTSQCILAPVNSLYASQDYLYLMHSGSSWWGSQETAVHSFRINDLSYHGTIVTPGNLGDQPQFRIKETNDALVMVLSESTNGSLNHQIKTYSLSDFEPLATLPNAQHPEVIGKPGEDIRSVRIEQNTLYLVTFLRTDPLYQFDITDPTNPTYIGELEVTGFSSYLHSISDELLLGLGYEADEQGRLSGIKVSLYEASENDPVEIDRVIYPGRYLNLPVSWDHHAFSFLSINDEFRFTMPFLASESYLDQTAGIALFSVSLNTQTPELTEQPMINAESIWRSRCVLQGPAVHCLTGDYLIHSKPWGSPDDVIQTMDLNADYSS